MNTELSLQNMADMIKAHASTLKPALRRVLMLYVVEMERATWYPGAWQAAIEAAGGLLWFDRDGLHIKTGGNLFVPLLELFDRYWTLAGIEPFQPPPPQKRLTLQQAADYLSVTVPTMKKYVYRDHAITGEMVGGVLWFSADDLDRFAATRSQASRSARERAARQRVAGDPD